MTDISEQRLAQLKAAAHEQARPGGQARPDGQSVAVPREDLLALIAAAEAATRQRAPWRPTHRHLKSGGDYRVICAATLEADRTDAVVYDDRDGTVWVRSAAEFYDGRFAELSPSS